MERIIKSAIIPANSTIANGFGSIDYQDIYTIKQHANKSAEEISKGIFTMPGWVDLLFRLRNGIISIFGLKTPERRVGSDSIFTVIENRDEEIVMGEDDKHLNFRTSILKDKSKGTLSLITVVHYNNVWGRIYFFPVKPFHRLIVKAGLKRYLRNQN